MFLAAATLVTSAGLSSGLTSLAETVSSNTRNNVRREVVKSTDSDATDNDASKPTPTPPSGGATVDEGQVEVKVEEEVEAKGVTKIVADEAMNLEVKDVKAEEKVPSKATESNEAFVEWLQETVIKTVANILRNVKLDTIDQTTVRQFEITGEKAGLIKMEFDEDYVKSFGNRKPIVLHKHNNSWERISAKFNGRVLEFKMDKFSPVIIFAAEETDTATPSSPSRGSSSNRGSNSSSGKATVTNEVNTTTLTGTWKRDAKGWWFQTTGGGYPRNRWGIINGKWYFFGNDGYMKTGWVQSNGAWYYCNPDANNGSEGEMKTGWIVDNGKWFYLGRTGAMETGWVQVNGVYYYLNPVSDGSRGAMAVNTWIGNYYVGADGAWQQNKTR